MQQPRITEAARETTLFGEYEVVVPGGIAAALAAGRSVRSTLSKELQVRVERIAERIGRALERKTITGFEKSQSNNRRIERGSRPESCAARSRACTFS
jgi:cytidylate kinase